MKVFKRSRSSLSNFSVAVEQIQEEIETTYKMKETVILMAFIQDTNLNCNINASYTIDADLLRLGRVIYFCPF